MSNVKKSIPCPWVDPDGNKHWLVDSKHHRIGGPAIEYKWGEKHWFFDGYLHRLDGPAVEYGDEPYSMDPEWHFNGDYIPVSSQEEFERYLKFIALK